MIKRVLWAFMHTNKMNSGISLPKAANHPFNFISQKLIKDLVASDLPERNSDNINLFKVKERMSVNEEQFKLGAEEAYKVILSDFSNRADFVATNYCTPKLSFTLNFLNFRMKNIGIDLPLKYTEKCPVITMTILGHWFDMEETRSNDKLFGLWDVEHIKSEISAGFVGPEINVMKDELDNMTYIPIKQTVRIVYKVEYDNFDDANGSGERIDVFDWERSLSCPVDKEEWTVANINSLLI